MSVPFFDLKIQNSKIRKEIDFAISAVVDSAHFILGKSIEPIDFVTILTVGVIGYYSVFFSLKYGRQLEEQRRELILPRPPCCPVFPGRAPRAWPLSRPSPAAAVAVKFEAQRKTLAAAAAAAAAELEPELAAAAAAAGSSG